MMGIIGVNLKKCSHFWHIWDIVLNIVSHSRGHMCPQHIIATWHGVDPLRCWSMFFSWTHISLSDTIVLSCYCCGCVEFWSKFNDPPTPTPPVFYVHILIRILIQTQKRVPWASSFLGAYPHLDVVVSVSSINGSSGTFHTVRSNTTTSGGEPSKKYGNVR